MQFFRGLKFSTQNIYCKCATCRRFSQIHMNFRRSEDADKSITSTLQRLLSEYSLLRHLSLRYKKTMRRPVSTIEFDKLIKFKSEIQLNLSKKVFFQLYLASFHLNLQITCSFHFHLYLSFNGSNTFHNQDLLSKY